MNRRTETLACLALAQAFDEQDLTYPGDWKGDDAANRAALIASQTQKKNNNMSEEQKAYGEPAAEPEIKTPPTPAVEKALNGIESQLAAVVAKLDVLAQFCVVTARDGLTTVTGVERANQVLREQIAAADQDRESKGRVTA